jgi:hypothetical protein
MRREKCEVLWGKLWKKAKKRKIWEKNAKSEKKNLMKQNREIF